MISKSRETVEALLSSKDLSARSIGLRHDRVAVNLLEELERSASVSVPRGLCVIVSVTAPLRRAAKLSMAIEARILELSESGQVGRAVTLKHGANLVRLKFVKARTPRFVGFVHNQATPAPEFIDLIAEWLQKPSSRR